MLPLPTETLRRLVPKFLQETASFRGLYWEKSTEKREKGETLTSTQICNERNQPIQPYL